MNRLATRTLWAATAWALAAGVTAGVALAAFSSTTATTGTFTSKRIYGAARTTTAFQLDDAADGSAAGSAATLAFADGAYLRTKQWTGAAFDPTHYLDVDLNSSLPDGVAVTGAAVSVRFSDDLGGGGENFCYYLDVRRASTGAVLGTYGSAAAPLGCETAAVLTTVTTSVPALTTTDDLNDLRVRIYGRHSTGKEARFDAVTVGATMLGIGVTLYPERQDDAANAVSAVARWGVAHAGDGASFQTGGNWSSSFAANRHVTATFPKYVPGAAQVTSASLTHSYRSTTSGDTSCWYAEVYDGTTLIGTHGSAATPVSCNATTGFATDVVPLPEVDTPGEAGRVVVRIYVKNSGGRRTDHDHIRLSVTYSLSATGCTDPRTVTVPASEDTYVDEASPAATFADSVDLKVRSRTGGQNRRAFVDFDVPSLGDGCSLQSATLRVFFNGVQAGGTRTIEARPVTAAWDDATLTWTNQPATGAAAGTTTNTAGWMQATVTTGVQAMYAGSAHGFMLRDAVEGSATSLEQKIDSLEATAPAELVIVIG